MWRSYISMTQTAIPQVLNCYWKDLLQKKELGSAKMEPSAAIEETHAKQFEIQTNPVCNYSEDFIPIDERKWNDILAYKHVKLVMRLQQHDDQDERETDGVIEVPLDDGPRPALDLFQTNPSQKIRFQIWTVHDVGMNYEHLMRERVLHNDKTEITPNPKHLRVVLHSVELTNCRPAPTPSVGGSVKHKPDDDVDLDVQGCRLHRGIVGSLQYVSSDRCDVQFGTKVCAQEMKQPPKDATEIGWQILGRNPVSESCSHETWN